MHHYDLFERSAVSGFGGFQAETAQESIRRLEEFLAAKARCGDWRIDEAPYNVAGRDPGLPILFAGSLSAKVCVLGRDLGREEVLAGEPLVGAAGRRLRRALYVCLFGSEPNEGDRSIGRVLEHVLLANIVPFKPIGNAPFPREVREEVRPAVAQLLGCLWQGNAVITLGNEAFHWFEPYCKPGEVRRFWARPNRFEAMLECWLPAGCREHDTVKRILVAPLPHPSPLNRRYFQEFESLVRKRWQQIEEMHTQTDQQARHATGLQETR